MQKRQQHRFAEGLINPSLLPELNYSEIHHLDHWGYWQASLEKPLLILGQDWGTVEYYRNYLQDPDSNRTNQNLRSLLTQVGWDPGTVSAPEHSTIPLFFTNVILAPFLQKPRSMPTSWLREGVEVFIDPLLEILQPRAIVTLGRWPYEALRKYGQQGSALPVAPLKTLIQHVPFHYGSVPLFSFYHCGGLGLVQRALSEQQADWQRLKKT